MKKKIAPSEKLHKRSSALVLEQTVPLGQLEKGAPASRVCGPRRAHCVGSMTQHDASAYSLLCSGTFVLREKPAHPYSKAQYTWPSVFLILIIIWKEKTISLGHSPHLSSPHKREGREYFLASRR